MPSVGAATLPRGCLSCHVLFCHVIHSKQWALSADACKLAKNKCLAFPSFCLFFQATCHDTDLCISSQIGRAGLRWIQIPPKRGHSKVLFFFRSRGLSRKWLSLKMALLKACLASKGPWLKLGSPKRLIAPKGSSLQNGHHYNCFVHSGLAESKVAQLKCRGTYRYGSLRGPKCTQKNVLDWPNIYST